MEFLLGVFAGPFILFGVLSAGLVWWAWIILLGGLSFVEACVFREEGEWAFFWLVAVSLLVAYILVPNIPDASWYAEPWAAVKTVLVVMVDYLILGLLFSVPLWFWFVRKRLVSLRANLYGYVQDRAKSGYLWSYQGDTLSSEQIKMCIEYRLGGSIPVFLQDNWSHYRRSELGIKDGDNKFIQNLDTVSSFVFLWPFHYIYLFFGDILTKIPELFARYFGPLIDALTRFVRIGIPDNIDG